MLAEQSAALGIESHGSPEKRPGKTVLVVDDEALQVGLLRELLEFEGYSTRTATSGREAVEVYVSCHPDAVLLDVSMPTMDGISTLDAIRKIDPEARVAMLSGFGQRAIVEEARQAGARDYIVKPVDLSRVLQVVADLVA